MDENNERSLDILLELLKDDNKQISFIKELLKIDVNYIFQYYKIYLKDFNEDYIRSKKDAIKNKDINQKIAIMMKVNQILYGFIPRKVQILSLLLFIKYYKNGLIEEIKTGEGKSIIIAFLATLKALEGKNVDIITSSPVLAQRDSQIYQKFYEYFGLSCDYCHEDEENNNSLVYNNYNSNIVYGTVLSFAGDYLRTNFIGTKGRGNRNFDVIIIDEIDNICLDNIMNQTQLIDNFKGYKFLEYIYLFIYYNLQQISIQYLNNNNNLSLLKNNKYKIVENLLILFNEFYERNLIEKRIAIPPHLNEYIQKRKKDWCNCAFDALFNYKLNMHYLISYDKEYKFYTIKPIDYSNTGIIEDKSIWIGLHQFLEIKHGLRLTEENLNSCFISNLCFFRLYNEKYGLTGTVGSEKTQEVLKKIYNLDVVFIPTFLKSKYQFNSKTDFFCDSNKQNFLETLITEIYKKYNENRAILVIVKFIAQINLIKQKIKELSFINEEDIIIYDRNDNPEQNAFLQNEIEPKKIILSTNLCGRGTDIRISKECEKNGGLFVILTFNPDSTRTEKQALGRAARKGENGSGKIMIYGNSYYEKIQNEREFKENKKFNYLLTSFKQRTIFFQDLFNRFCYELNKIKQRPNVNKNQIQDIKERWGLFLINNDFNKLEEKDYLEQINSNNSIKNGNNYAKINVEIIKNGIGIDGIYRKIQENFDSFITEIFYNNQNYKYFNQFQIVTDFENKDFQIEQNINDSLFFMIDYYQIYKKIIAKINKDQAYFEDIKSNFINLKQKVNSLINQYKIYEELIKKIKYVGNNTDLLNQNNQKINYLNIFIQNLDENISFFEKIISNKTFKNNNVFTIKFKEIEYENEDIRKYFYDFGLLTIFTLRPSDSCIIF